MACGNIQTLRLTLPRSNLPPQAFEEMSSCQPCIAPSPCPPKHCLLKPCAGHHIITELSENLPKKAYSWWINNNHNKLKKKKNKKIVRAEQIKQRPILIILFISSRFCVYFNWRNILNINLGFQKHILVNDLYILLHVLNI